MDLVGNPTIIPDSINGMDVSVAKTWFLTNGGDRGLDVEIAEAATSDDGLLQCFLLIVMHWAPLETVPPLKDMIECEGFLGLNRPGATRRKCSQWSLWNGADLSKKIGVIAKDIRSKKFPFARQAYRIGVTITDPDFSPLMDSHVSEVKICMYLNILKAVGSSGCTIATARRFVAAVDRFIIARASGYVSAPEEAASFSVEGAGADAPWSKCGDRTGGLWRSFIVQQYNLHCNTGNAASRLIDFPGVGGCAGLVLVHLVILEDLYPDLGYALEIGWKLNTSPDSVCCNKDQALVVLQRVIEDPLSAILNPSVESGKTLREECSVVRARFLANTSTSVKEYSSLHESDYMDAGNIAMFFGRKLQRQFYVRRIVSKRDGGEADAVYPFPNFMEGSFVIEHFYAKRIEGEEDLRDWRWQIAYMAGVGSGHTCLLVDASPGVDLFA